ncbi:MAG TPA: DUF374 domain-containing protein [bacterium]|nr:DUF374 domain-containing protein [bacterium]
MKNISPQFLGKLAWYFVKIIEKTLSIDKITSDELSIDKNKAVIYAVWHGRMFFPLLYLRDMGVIPLVSEHRDGEIISATLDSAGYETVRGSTTRGGAKALAKLVRFAKQGSPIAITPDGPGGPKWHFQPGAIYVAAKSGIPIVPLAGSAKRAFYFKKSWDSFQLPLPFTKCVYIVGEPYYITGGLDEENIEFHRAELEKRLTNLIKEADEKAGAKVGL